MVENCHFITDNHSSIVSCNIISTNLCTNCPSNSKSCSNSFLFKNNSSQTDNNHKIVVDVQKQNEDYNKESNGKFWLIDTSTPEALERDFYAWLRVNDNLIY